MIIKRRNNKQPEIPRENVSEAQSGLGDFGFEPSQQTEQFSDEQNFEMGVDVPDAEIPQNREAQKAQEFDEIDLFNLDNIDFKQRQERRRGDRRRGFRRGDDRNLISRAREEAASIREAASKEGYQEGLARAEEDVALMKQTLSEFVNAPQEVFEYIAPELLEICVDIAQKIVKTEITQNPQVVLDKIVEILKTLSKEEPKVTVRVNPMQVSIAKQAIPQMLEMAGLETKLVVLPDETVTEGGCVVNTNNGVIDATIESQLAIVKEALKEI